MTIVCFSFCKIKQISCDFLIVDLNLTFLLKFLHWICALKTFNTYILLKFLGILNNINALRSKD